MTCVKKKEGTKDTRGTVKLINRKKNLTTPWLKMKKTKQTNNSTHDTT